MSAAGWTGAPASSIPLAYTLELARLCIAAAARITANRRVTGLTQRGGIWRAVTERGETIAAKSVVVATNAYSDGLVPGLAAHHGAASFVPDRDETSARRTGRTNTARRTGRLDSRRILIYFRKSPDGRFMLGGRGRMSLPRSAADWSHLEHAMVRLFPALAGIAIERRWFGRVAMTPDHLPQMHEPEKGLVAAVGCQGRGIGLMTALGLRIADYVATGNPDTLPFPVSPIRPIPFHRFRQIGVAATIAWYRSLDALER